MKLRKTFWTVCYCLFLGIGNVCAGSIGTANGNPEQLVGTWRMDMEVMNYPVTSDLVIEKDEKGWWLVQEPYRYKMEVRDNGALFFTSSYGNMPTELEVSADEKGVVKVTIEVNGQEFTSELERVEEN